MATKRSSQGNKKRKSNKEKSKEQTNKCFMAKDNEVSDLTFDDMIEINSELLDTLKSLKRKYKEALENQKKAEFERDMLKDEKRILEEELEKIQDSDNSQLALLSQEIEAQKEKNNALASENHELKTKIKIVELDNTSLKTKLDDITKNISNFNKGRENLSRIIENSQPASNKKGLGYVKNSRAHNDRSGVGYKQAKSKNSTRYAFMYTNFSASTSNQDSFKTSYSHNSTLFRNDRNYSSSTKLMTNSIKIWIPANMIDHDKQLYISNYYKNVICNENYIYKGSTTPKWVWFPKT